MVLFSGTTIVVDDELNSFKDKPITIKVTRERINAAITGNILPNMVEPRSAANAGPTINPRLEEIAILPKFLLLFSLDETSAR